MGVGATVTQCQCDHAHTGRCWLRVDQYDFDRNFTRLQARDPLAVYTFALLERVRLAEKIHEMERCKIESITPEYCAAGTQVQSEAERNQMVLDWIECHEVQP